MPWGKYSTLARHKRCNWPKKNSSRNGADSSTFTCLVGSSRETNVLISNANKQNTCIKFTRFSKGTLFVNARNFTDATGAGWNYNYAINSYLFGNSQLNAVANPIDF